MNIFQYETKNKNLLVRSLPGYLNGKLNNAQLPQSAFGLILLKDTSCNTKSLDFHVSSSGPPQNLHWLNSHTVVNNEILLCFIMIYLRNPVTNFKNRNVSTFSLSFADLCSLFLVYSCSVMTSIYRTIWQTRVPSAMFF